MIGPLKQARMATMIISYFDYQTGTNVKFSEFELASLMKGSSIKDVFTKEDIIYLR